MSLLPNVVCLVNLNQFGSDKHHCQEGITQKEEEASWLLQVLCSYGERPTNIRKDKTKNIGGKATVEANVCFWAC